MVFDHPQESLKLQKPKEADMSRLLACRDERDVQALSLELNRSPVDLLLIWYQSRTRPERPCRGCRHRPAAEGSAYCYDCGAALRRSGEAGITAYTE